MDKIRIALADDEPLFRKGISLLLQNTSTMTVIFEADNGQELIDKLREGNSHPDIVIMDLKMPVLNGIETSNCIHEEFPDIKIIALTSYHTKSFVANMIAVGAASYLVKNTTPDELITTIKEVHKTGSYYTPDILKIIDECFIANQKGSRAKFMLEELTRREEEILKLICRQHSAGEIAEKLFLSIRTVEGHKNNLLRKTESKNTIGLIVYALLHDYVTIDSLLET